MEGAGGLMMLYEALQGASSQDPRVLKEAEAKLSVWENHAGFYPALAVRDIHVCSCVDLIGGE